MVGHWLVVLATPAMILIAKLALALIVLIAMILVVGVVSIFFFPPKYPEDDSD